MADRLPPGSPRLAGQRYRWECTCQQPPILLACYDEQGWIEVKVRERRYLARGWLAATCPRCGTRHVLQLPHGTVDGLAPRSAPPPASADNAATS